MEQGGLDGCHRRDSLLLADRHRDCIAVALFGVPVGAFVIFDGALDRYAGMAAWWLIFFGPALVYAAPVFPWQQTRGFPSQRQK